MDDDKETANDETVNCITGTTEPVHRVNDLHPIEGRCDGARDMLGNRRRIEQLEFRLGHVICGYKSNLTGEYCTTLPVPGTMRCAKHKAKQKTERKQVANPHYTMTSNVFQRCQLCRLKDCAWRNLQTGGSECVVERDLYETLTEEAKKFDKYGEATKHMFEQLVWSRVLLYRAFSQLAAEGLVIKEVTGFTEREGLIVPLENDREHPVLKHIAKLQQMDKQICDALELTPAAFTKKGESESSKEAQSSLADLMKKSLQKFRESGENI
jgi:hypothetical protein